MSEDIALIATAPYIGARLRAIRKEQRVSQVELALMSGASNSFISDIERGRTEPSIAMLARILEPLDVTLGEFFTVPDAPGYEAAAEAAREDGLRLGGDR